MHYRFLTETDRERIHTESIRILKEVGVRYNSKKALKLLRQAGALVDHNQSLARIDQAMVEGVTGGRGT